MSSTNHTQEPYLEPPIPHVKEQPPNIPKPKTSKHSFTNEILQQAFEVDYFLRKTGDWQEVKIVPVVRVFKLCCDGPLHKYSSEFELAVRGFRHQSEALRNKIYDDFLENIQRTNASSRFREVLLDMLEATKEDKWLFVWIAGQIMRQKPGAWRIHPTTSTVQNNEVARQVENNSSLTIYDLIN